jgi:Fe-S-cluster-containing dehydrogenase component
MTAMKILWVSTKFTRQEAELEKLPEEETILMVDLDRCISCGACQYACQIEHRRGNLSEAKPRVFSVKMKEGNNACRSIHLPLSCRHCDTPCEYYDSNNFWVTCNSDAESRDDLCDSCADRSKNGLMPACAMRCSMKCIYFGYAKDILFALNEKRLRQMGEVLADCVLER